MTSMRLRRLKQGNTPLIVGVIAVLAVATLSLASAGIARGAELRADSTAALVDALGKARPGAVIKLAPGNYSGVVLKNATKRDVRIESAIPARPAVLHDLTLTGSSGISFRNLEFFLDPEKAGSLFQVRSSNAILFDGIRMHGSLDGNPRNDRNGLSIERSSNVRVMRSRFSELRVPVTHIASNGLQFVENVFQDTALGGIWGGGSSNVTISKNLFSNFYPAADGHPDAVNFFTTGTKASARDIVVRDNVFLRGKGLISQGIFFRDQLDAYPFQNVYISGNLIVGGMHNGIAVDGARGVTLVDNVVAALPDAKSRIYLENAADVRMGGNRASAYVMGPGNSRVSSSDNGQVERLDDGGAAVAAEWFNRRPQLAQLAKKVGFFGAMNAAGTAPPAPGRRGPALVAAGSTKDRKQAGKTLSGGNGADKLVANGHDAHMLKGGSGDDVLGGGNGDDVLMGGPGNDRAFGGRGSDQFVFGASEIEGTSDTDRIFDLNFNEGDTLLLSDFPGGRRLIRSYDDIVKATSAFAGVIVSRAGQGNDNLALQVTDADGDVQIIIISAGWGEYVRARQRHAQ